MKVLKATNTQFAEINNFTNGSSKLEFQKDANNNWIVGIEVLEDESFLNIKKQLQALLLIDYNPIIIKI